MKKIIFLLAVLIAAAFIFDSCGKYEDGPKISLRSKSNRVQGDWKVTQYTINGKDQLEKVETINDTCGDGSPYTSIKTSKIRDWLWLFGTEDFSYNFKSDTTIAQSGCVTFTTSITETYTEHGTWEFNSSKTSLVLTYLTTNTGGNVILQEWDIIELRKRQMKLKHIGLLGTVSELKLNRF